MKKLLIGVVVVLVILIAAAVALPFVVPVDAVTDRVKAEVESRTGRTLEIGGPTSLSFFPSLGVEMADVRLGNVEGGQAESMVELGRLDVGVALWPLLRGEVEIGRLILERPVISLEVDAEGRPNWELTTGEPAPVEPAGEGGGGGQGGSAPPEIRLGDVRVVDGTIRYSDARTGEDVTLSDVDLQVELPSLDDPLNVAGSLVLKEKPVTISVRANQPRGLLSGNGTALALAVASEPLTLDFDGTLAAADAPAAAGEVAIDIPSIAALLEWLPVAVAVGPLPVDSLKASGTIDAGQTRFAVTGLDLAADGMTARGDLRVVVAERPAVEGTLALGRIDLDRLMAAAAAAEAGAAGVTPVEEAPTQAPEDGRIDLSALSAADVNLTVTAEEIIYKASQIGPLDAAVTMAAGDLKAEVREARMFGGTLHGMASVVGSGAEPAFRLELHAADIAAGAALALAGAAPEMKGVLTADITAEATGATRQALAESLTASGTIHIADGAATIEDPRGGAPIALDAVNLDVAMADADGPLTAEGSLTLDGEPVELTASVGDPRAVVAGSTVPAFVHLASARGSLDFDGEAAVSDEPRVAGAVDLAVPSITALAEWLRVALPPEPLPVDELAFTGRIDASASRIAVTGAALDVGEDDASGDLAVTLSGARPRIEGELTLSHIDINRYLPPLGEEADGTPEAGGGQPAGWSEEPIDLSALLAADADLLIHTGGFNARGYDIGPGDVDIDLANGDLDLSVSETPISEGRLAFDLGVHSSPEVPAMSLVMRANGVQVQPLLIRFADSDRLMGALAGDGDLAATGRSQRELVESLDGTLAFELTDGAIKGVDIAGMIRNVGSAFTGGGEARQTDFAALGASFVITDGLAATSDISMLAPLFRIEGAGQTDLPPRTLDFRLVPRLVASIQGQGGTRDIGGFAVPIVIAGTFDNPTYRPDLAGAITEGLSDPGAIGGMLEGLTGGGGSAPAAPGGEAAPQGQPELRDPAGALRGLFGN